MVEENKQEVKKIEEKAQAQAAKPAKELQTNCLGCGKPINKLKRYYRDGKFYCNKICWRKTVKSKSPK